MKTLVFIPCCEAKQYTVPTGPATWITPSRVPASWASIARGRCLRGLGNSSLPKFWALSTYVGNLYTAAPSLRQIATNITIISAGYGLVGGNDSIASYNCKMEGAVARDWRDLGLDRIVAELIRTERPTRVVGFFAGPSAWSNSGPMYRWFYQEGVRQAMQSIRLDTAGIVYRAGGPGRNSIMGVIGKVLEEFLNSDLSPDFLTASVRRFVSGVAVSYLPLS